MFPSPPVDTKYLVENVIVKIAWFATEFEEHLRAVLKFCIVSYPRRSCIIIKHFYTTVVCGCGKKMVYFLKIVVR